GNRTLRMVEFEAENDAPLPDADENIGICSHHFRKAAAEEFSDKVDVGDDLGPLQNFHYLMADNAAQFRAAGRGDMCGAILMQPAAAVFRDDTGRYRIDAAAEALARDEHVGLQSVGLPAPHYASPHQARLHLVGDVERTITAAQVLAGLQIAVSRHREAVGGWDRLDDEGGDIAPAQCPVERVDVIERNVYELVGPIGQEYLRETIVARR